nr:AraC family transcriptional regulator [uncultured Allomuricauda sp.]
MKSTYEHQSNPTGKRFLVKNYRQANFTSGFHFHDLYELIYIKKSYGKLHTERTIIDFYEGDIFLIGPGYGHCFYNDKKFVQSGLEAEAVVIFFEKDFLGDDFFKVPDYKETQDLLDNSNFGLRIKKTDAHLINLIETINQKDGLQELITLLEILDYLTDLLPNGLDILSEIESAIDPFHSDYTKLKPVLEYVVKNFKSNITNQKAAEIAHLNEAAFCRYFKKRMELTFSQYVNNVRLAHAKDLLLSKDWDIAQICYQCGYNNISYFNRKFREITGKSPKEFRDSYQSTNEELVMDNQSD